MPGKDSRRTADILVVDDEPYVRDVLSRFLKPSGHQVRQAADVSHARMEIATKMPDIVFLDINMPGPPGMELLEELAPQWPSVAVIMATAVGDVGTAMQAIRAGAADYIHKPLDFETVRFVLSRTLERRHVYLQNISYRERLEALVEERTAELRQKTQALVRSQDALVRGLCMLSEFRDKETGAHLDRMSRYAQMIAKHMVGSMDGATQPFDDLVHMAAPLHDIGKVGIPDAILLKPGTLTDDERRIMQRHTIIGAETIAHVRERLGGEHSAFLDVAYDICLGHHERWDGKGYPHGRHGAETPLSARIAAVADNLDACLSARPYRRVPMQFVEVTKEIMGKSGTAFDPEVTAAYFELQDKLEKVWAASPDPDGLLAG